MSKEDERNMMLSLLFRIELNILKEKYSDSKELIDELRNHVEMMENKK